MTRSVPQESLALSLDGPMLAFPSYALNTLSHERRSQLHIEGISVDDKLAHRLALHLTHSCVHSARAREVSQDQHDRMLMAEAERRDALQPHRRQMRIAMSTLQLEQQLDAEQKQAAALQRKVCCMSIIGRICPIVFVAAHDATTATRACK